MADEKVEKALEQKIMPITKEALSFVITSHDELTHAKIVEGNIKSLIKEVDDTFDPILRLTKDKKAKWKKPLTDAQEHLRNLMSGFILLQEQKRKAEEMKLLEIARKEQQKELERAEKKIAEILSKNTKVDEQVKELTKTLEKCTDNIEADIIRTQLELLYSKRENLKEKAKIKIQQAEQITTTVLSPITIQPKARVEGLSYKIIKEVEKVLDKIGIVKKVASGIYPIDILDINIVKVNRLLHMGVCIPEVGVKESAKLRTGE